MNEKDNNDLPNQKKKVIRECARERIGKRKSETNFGFNKWMAVFPPTVIFIAKFSKYNSVRRQRRHGSNYAPDV